MSIREPVTRTQQLASSDRAMFVVRLVGTAYALLQVTIAPAPGWVPPLGYLWAAGLLVCTVALRLAAVAGRADERRLAVLAWTGLGVDIAVVLAIATLYAFDPTAAIWAVLFVLPLEGAIRFGLAGALGAMTAASVLYVFRELWAGRAYGHPFEVSSVTYRLGIGYIIALVAGLMARNLRREREQAVAAYARLKELDDLKDGFLTAASHELRTPLTVITGFARTMRKHADLPTENRLDYLDAICKHADRLTRLANDLIDITRIRRGALPVHLEDVPAREIAERTVDILSAPVEVDVPADLAVHADPARVEQILHNLLENAAKYGRPPFELTGRAHGEHVALAVIDHGEGAPDADRIFDLFYRGPTGQSGSGVGLTFARQLAEAMGGTLSYEPRDGRTCFLLRLPSATVRSRSGPGRS